MTFRYMHVMAVLLILTMVSLFLFHGFSSPTSISSSTIQHDLAESTGFCQHMFMVMSMSGFQWSLVGHTPGDCLNYFAPAWKLDDRGKFQGAMVYTVLLGLLTEGSHALQVVLQPYVPPRLRHVVNSLLYGLQRFMGYTIMLVSMTYSWELFLSVLVGVMLGRLLFPNATRREWLREARHFQRNTPPAGAHPTLATTLDDSQHNGDESGALLLASDNLAVRRRRL
jgi:hypothetical protein